MTKRKVTLILLITLILYSFSLTGCSNKNTGKTTKDPTKEPLKIRLSTIFLPEQPDYQFCEEFKERVEKETNGNIQVSLYPANQLGDYTVVFEEIMKGTIDMCMNTIPSNYDPRLEVLYLHYIAENYDQVREYFGEGSYIYNLIDEICLDKNIKFLGFHGGGFSGLGLIKEPNSPTDPKVAKSVLIRVPPMEVFKSWADDMNYKTVSLPYEELYTALQTGVAEGWSGGQPAVNYFAYRDVIKYYYQYNTYFENHGWCMNLNLWESLPPEHQTIISNIIKDLSVKSVIAAEENDELYMKKLEEHGVKVTTFTDEDLKTMAEHTRKVGWPKLENRLGKEIIENLKEQYNH